MAEIPGSKGRILLVELSGQRHILGLERPDFYSGSSHE